jgi:Protein of unknown function (DUF1592)/Protein of unknown function (DUF1588)/Protein of unknown function (DUF1595)/Protein of unknown function (DUF1587)/Protein of unknown function (DUF1585)
MKNVTFRILGTAVLVAALSFGLAARGQRATGAPATTPAAAPAPAVSHAPAGMPADAQVKLVQEYCIGCHDDAQKPGGVTLEHFTGAQTVDPNIAGMMARKLKAGQMPPAGMPKPDEASASAFIDVLQTRAIPGSENAVAAAAPVETKVVSFPHTGDVMPVAAQNAVIKQVCTQCHNDRQKAGGVSMVGFDVTTAPEHAELVETMIAKVRAGMMPKLGAPIRPDAASARAFVVSLEQRLDRSAALHPDPGRRTFQRLNRAEYAESIDTMLGIDVDVSQWLPPDTISHNFDNIADAQSFSPTLLQGYLGAADAISRLAVGDPAAGATSSTYSVDRTASQMEHVDGAPFGTRGGLAVVHVFPADGTYRFKMLLHGTPTGQLFGKTVLGEQIEISINGRRAALLDISPTLDESDPNGLTVQTPPIQVAAGPQRVAAAFIKHFDGPVDDMLEPHEHTLADTQIGDAAGVTTLPHLRDLTITGPYHTTGVSDTVSRRMIFTCRPTTPAEEAPCARSIVSRLAAQAYRRPVTAGEVGDLMKFYDQGRKDGDFESGIRLALQALLVSPHFLFRIEEQPDTVRAGQNYTIDSLDLASRLSYFIWAAPPDAELLKVASAGTLQQPAVLDREVKRMLKDPRSETLSTRFASEWLRLQDVSKMHPDAITYPYYDATLGEAMVRETQLFFDSIVKEDRNVLDLLTADYTFVNERLANHYGIPGVAGADFRRVSLAGTHRQGLLGQGSILVLTSVADRTSPVQRGKWVLEVLLGQPPPPPPPNVPALDDEGSVAGGRVMTVRERMEEHRKNPFCASCHKVIDPIGLSLENFDPTGQYRIKDSGVPVDTSGTLYDGTKMVGLTGLEQALMNHQDTFLRVFTENLMAYALGRRVEYYDMPTVRSIIRKAGADDNRFSSYVLGVVNSPAFRMSRAKTTTVTTAAQQ